MPNPSLVADATGRCAFSEGLQQVLAFIGGIVMAYFIQR
jgi:hypothetical protein